MECEECKKYHKNEHHKYPEWVVAAWPIWVVLAVLVWFFVFEPFFSSPYNY